MFLEQLAFDIALDIQNQNEDDMINSLPVIHPITIIVVAISTDTLNVDALKKTKSVQIGASYCKQTLNMTQFLKNGNSF